jgi:uncharacterized repeat protein (TIGR03803 family)
MNRDVGSAVFFGLLIGSAVYAANPLPVPVFTFTCNGNGSGGRHCPNGGRPDWIIQGSDGKFYGAAWDSQEGSSQPQGGTIFSLTRSGTFTVLHSFPPGSGNTYRGGDNPADLIEGSDGNLYGSTADGGSPNGGVLFRIGKDGSAFKILHEFCSSANCADGAGPGSLVSGEDGNVYGTSAGGANGYGTIFRITPSTGAYQVLFNFGSTLSLNYPTAMTVGPDGNLYGLQGEALFHFNMFTGGFQEALLPFPLENELPSVPTSGLTVGPNGNLYGLYTIYPQLGSGVFEVAPDGSNFQLLPEYTADRGTPGNLLFATDGNFWLAEYDNGTTGYGDIVTLSPSDGALLETVTTFTATDAAGAYPAVLIQAKDGTLWGATQSFGKASKGSFADGAVFSLNAGLPPLQ